MIPLKPSSRRGFFRNAAVLCASATGLRGSQQAPDEPIFTAGVKVVNILATVRNKKGEIVSNLDKDAFQVAENGRPQALRYFSRDSDLPLTVGLLIDTSMSQERVLDAERGACFKFLDQVLRENKDKFFIVQFDMSVQIKQDLTSSRAKLDDALSFVDTPTRKQLELGGWGPSTVLFDAVKQMSKDVMRSESGRKALIVLSDGVDEGSDTPISDAIEAAQRADTLIYSVLFSDASFYWGSGAGSVGRRALQRLSRETGGSFYEVSKKAPIGQIFQKLEEELRTQYSMGYVSDEPVTISEFRKIQVTTKEKGFTVQTRDKYFARR